MNHKARQLILHFGLAKTGTTAIQQAVFCQREALIMDQGVLYPGEHENHYYLQAMFASHPESLYHVQMLNLADSEAIGVFLEEYLNNVVAEINEKKPDRIILSSEYFPSMCVDELKAFKIFLDSIAEEILLFAYVRDPWSFSVSYLQEMVRSGLMIDGEKEARIKYRSTINVFKKFKDVFNLHPQVVPYLPGKFDVIEDFCQRFKLKLNRNTEYSAANQSMKREALCAMVELIKHYPVFNNQGKFIPDPPRDWMIEALQNSPLSRTPIKISKTTADKIYAASKVDIDFMEENFFHGEKVFSNYFALLNDYVADDTLSVSVFEQDQLAEYFLSCMRLLSERAISYYLECLFCTGKFYVATENPDAAKSCFRELLNINPQHQSAIEQMRLLEEADSSRNSLQEYKKLTEQLKVQLEGSLCLLQEKEVAIGQMQSQLYSYSTRLCRIESSLSWHITAPLRFLGDWFRRKTAFDLPGTSAKL